MSTFSEHDLLGEYEFNPFVELDVELDYDENMEEINVLEDSQEDLTKNEEGEQVTGVIEEYIFKLCLSGRFSD